jgi:hypothetical protein
MDLHQLALRRSLAYHRAIARRLLVTPSIIEAARTRVYGWLAETPERPFAKMWAEVLSDDAPSIAASIVDEGEIATPFAGVLDPRERWRIWRQVREEVEGTE